MEHWTMDGNGNWTKAVDKAMSAGKKKLARHYKRIDQNIADRRARIAEDAYIAAGRAKAKKRGK
jgi:hypothetical protein